MLLKQILTTRQNGIRSQCHTSASLEVTSIRHRNDIEKACELVDISSILKVDFTSSYPHRIDVVLSTWIRLS